MAARGQARPGATWGRAGDGSVAIQETAHHGRRSRRTCSPNRLQTTTTRRRRNYLSSARDGDSRPSRNLDTTSSHRHGAGCSGSSALARVAVTATRENLTFGGSRSCCCCGCCVWHSASSGCLVPPASGTRLARCINEKGRSVDIHKDHDVKSGRAPAESLGRS